MKKVPILLIVVGIAIGITVGSVGTYLLMEKPPEVLTDMRIVIPFIWNAGDASEAIALEKGWFEERGLKPKIWMETEVEAPLVALVAGMVDVAGINPAEAIVAINEGLPITLIAARTTIHPGIYLSLKETGILGPKDWPGHVIGTGLGEEHEFFTRYLMEEHLTPEEIERVELVPRSYSPTPLIEGVYDVWSCFLETGLDLEFQGFELNYNMYWDLGFNAMGNSYAVSTDELRKNPEKFVEWFRVWSKGWDYSYPWKDNIGHREEVIDAIWDFVPKFNQDRDRLGVSYDSNSEHNNAPSTLERNIGWIDEEAIRFYAELLKDGGVIEEILPLEEYFTNEIVEQVYDEEWNLIWPGPPL